MRIKKTFQTTVPTGKVLNNRTESNVDTYSCDYINGLITTDILWTGRITDQGTITLNNNLYNYRFIVFDADFGTHILVPVIQNKAYLYGNFGLITGAGQYATTAITAVATDNGSKIQINSLKTITHTASSNHSALSNTTLISVYGIK